MRFLFQQFLRRLADLRFAILLLTLILICSVIGSIVEQSDSASSNIIDKPNNIKLKVKNVLNM